MKMRFLFVPLDDRPCTYKMFIKMAKIANIELAHPPEETLGKFQVPGDSDAILDWLNDIRGQFDGTVIATDMPVYGGLVASRKMLIHPEIAIARLERLIDIICKRRISLGKIMLFSSLLRTTPTYSDESFIPIIEKIIQFSSESYLGIKGNKRSTRIAEKLRKEIPPDILNEYLATRKRNYLINERLLHYAAEGIFDFLLIGIDDSKTVGLNIIEREKLEQIVSEKSLENCVSIAPGTDESAVLLLSRLLTEKTGIHPAIFPIYSDPEGKGVVGRYEDRSFEEIVSLHISIAGGVESKSKQNADIYLFIHNPNCIQKEASGQKLRLKKGNNYNAFIKNINNAIISKLQVVLADVFYANGADAELIEKLQENTNILKLGGFAAWNTSGNSIGTAIAHGIVYFIAKKLASSEDELIQLYDLHTKLLLERFIDDWLYQSEVRQQLSIEALLKGVSVFHLDEKTSYFENLLKERLGSRAKEFMESMSGDEIAEVNGRVLSFSPPQIKNIKLLWGRLFEVGFDLV